MDSYPFMRWMQFAFVMQIFVERIVLWFSEFIHIQNGYQTINIPHFSHLSGRLQTATNIDGDWSRDRIRVVTKQSTHEKLIVLFANHKFTESKWSTEFTWIGPRCRFGTWWSNTRKSQFEERRFNVTAEYANWKCECDASWHGQRKWSEWRFHAISSGGPLYGHHAVTAIANRCSATVSLYSLLMS